MGQKSVLVRGNSMYRGSDMEKDVTHVKDWRDECGQMGGPCLGMWACGCQSPSVLIPCVHETEGYGKKTSVFVVRKPDLKSWCGQVSIEPQLHPL